MKSYFFSVAPMMDYTDRHNRYLLRLIAPDIELYTEMITAQALYYGNAKKLLDYHPDEKYLALQLGGNDPKLLAYGAKLAADFGYDEINFNVGCPSLRVQDGKFGACLMLEPEIVAKCVAAMRKVVEIPITVKCRIGVDHQDSYADLTKFVQIITDEGCQKFIIHARKAWLSGLSPKENREIPPLQYETVRNLKRDFSHLTIILNGGLKTLSDIEAELPFVDGAMIGRAANTNPYVLAAIQAKYFNKKVLSRSEIVKQYIPYILDQLKNRIKLNSMTRHLLGLFYGQPGASIWKRYLSESTHREGAGVEVIENALKEICL